MVQNIELRAHIQLFKFEDRKQVPYLLSPTHEEEITWLVSRISQSYKDLPLRLYQISALLRRTNASPLQSADRSLSSEIPR